MELKYSLTRSRRRSIAILVRDGAVYVRAPLKASEKAINKFVAEKEEWIKKKLAESAERKNRFSDVFSFDAFPYLGERMNIVPTDKKTIAISNGEIFLPKIYCGVLDEESEKKFRSSLKRAYLKAAQSYLGERLNEISGYIGLRYESFALTNAKRKWGSCDGAGNIRLNWRLILLEKSLTDYVIVHELAHTVHHDHSRAFWNCVARYYPEYKRAIACLKARGALTEYPE